MVFDTDSHFQRCRESFRLYSLLSPRRGDFIDITLSVETFFTLILRPVVNYQIAGLMPSSRVLLAARYYDPFFLPSLPWVFSGGGSVIRLIVVIKVVPYNQHPTARASGRPPPPSPLSFARTSVRDLAPLSALKSHSLSVR